MNFVEILKALKDGKFEFVEEDKVKIGNMELKCEPVDDQRVKFADKVVIYDEEIVQKLSEEYQVKRKNVKEELESLIRDAKIIIKDWPYKLQLITSDGKEDAIYIEPYNTCSYVHDCCNCDECENQTYLTKHGYHIRFKGFYFAFDELDPKVSEKLIKDILTLNIVNYFDE